jgi:hypothetical protein
MIQCGRSWMKVSFSLQPYWICQTIVFLNSLLHMIHIFCQIIDRVIWSTILPEKLIDALLVTDSLLCSWQYPTWPPLVQSDTVHNFIFSFAKKRPIIILLRTLYFLRVEFSWDISTNVLPSLIICHQSNPPWFHCASNIWWEQITKLLIMNCLFTPVVFCLLCPYIVLKFWHGSKIFYSIY